MWCALALAVLAIGALAQPAPATAGEASLNVYRGLGAWVDIYEDEAWGNPSAAVYDMSRHGVRTLYLETANFRISRDLFDSAKIKAFIEAAHQRGIKVVAWYLPAFTNLDTDFRRCSAAIDLRTDSGQRFDSFALDIEHRGVSSLALRNQRVEELSRRLRDKVGAKYPLGGIIPSPVALEWQPPYWASFPYKTVASYYDVVLPMGYYTFHGDGAAQAYKETLDNIRILREKTGTASLPIHAIGGVAQDSTGAETLSYVRATRLTGVLGGSLYNWSETSADDWLALRGVRVNKLQTPAMPLSLGYTAPLGNCPQDATHVKEVLFVVPPQSGACTLSLRLWDVQANEVRLLVNWKTVTTFPAGIKARWTPTQRVTIPAKLLRANADNVIGFVAAGDYPTWRRWGVRNVSLAATTTP
jgi:hypothetical protein